MLYLLYFYLKLVNVLIIFLVVVVIIIIYIYKIILFYILKVIFISVLVIVVNQLKLNENENVVLATIYNKRNMYILLYWQNIIYYINSFIMNILFI